MSKGWEQMKKAREEDYFERQNRALLEKLKQKKSDSEKSADSTESKLENSSQS